VPGNKLYSNYTNVQTVCGFLDGRQIHEEGRSIQTLSSILKDDVFGGQLDDSSKTEVQEAALAGNFALR